MKLRSPKGKNDSLPSLLGWRALGMRSKQEGDNAVENETNPEIDEQTEVRDQPIAAMLGSHGQVRHEEEEVDEIPQNYRSEGYEEVPREAHSIL